MTYGGIGNFHQSNGFSSYNSLIEGYLIRDSSIYKESKVYSCEVIAWLEIVPDLIPIRKTRYIVYAVDESIEQGEKRSLTLLDRFVKQAHSTIQNLMTVGCDILAYSIRIKVIVLRPGPSHRHQMRNKRQRGLRFRGIALPFVILRQSWRLSQYYSEHSLT